MNKYQPTEDERKIVDDIEVKVNELQALFVQAAKMDIEVRFETYKGAFSLISPFIRDDSLAKTCRISWAAHKVQINRDLISGN